MFTGIIEQVGTVVSLQKKGKISRLVIKTQKARRVLKIGDSVAINGACLTVVEIQKGHLAFDIMKETFENTSLKYLNKSDRVNVEYSLNPESGLDGHFVLGHIDSVCKIKEIKKSGSSHSYVDIAVATGDKVYLVKKGSVAIDGISLTIGEVFADKFRVYIIPHTISNTTLQFKKSGDPVNVEFDILGKYILKRVDRQDKQAQSVTRELLKKEGFI